MIAVIARVGQQYAGSYVGPACSAERGPAGTAQ